MTTHYFFYMKKVYDAIIVGAGHNGLVAANYLAKQYPISSLKP